MWQEDFVPLCVYVCGGGRRVGGSLLIVATHVASSKAFVSITSVVAVVVTAAATAAAVTSSIAVVSIRTVQEKLCGDVHHLQLTADYSRDIQVDVRE